MTKEKANRNEVVGMFLTYCRKTLVNARTDVLRERKSGKVSALDEIHEKYGFEGRAIVTMEIGRASCRERV